MQVNLTEERVSTHMGAIGHAMRYINEAPDTPYEVSQQQLAKLDDFANQLRAARRS